MSLETVTPDILRSCRLNTQPDGGMRGNLDGSITIDGMPHKATPDEVIVYREKPAYHTRKTQIQINLLGLEGGRQYVNTRLSRFAGETEIDWIGGKRPDGSVSTGRLQQTHAFPYLGRIASKINQYVFNVPPARADADQEIVKDITRDGQSVNDIMREVSSLSFACGWCWVGIDAPARKDDGTQYSQAEKEEKKIRPYWSVYNPLDVMDWHFDERGELAWIKTRRISYDDSIPTTNPTQKQVITLWEKGKATEFWVEKSPDLRFTTGMRVKIRKVEIPLTDSKGKAMTVVPFVLAGTPSSKSVPFDDLESINRTIMDLGSVDRANFFNTNYPQLVLPASLLQRSVQDGYAKNAADVGKLILGFKYPIMLDKDDPEPKYLTPNASNLKEGSERVSSLKRELFEVVGLALEQGSRQVASAEAKAWDFLDVASVMSARAELLEEVEVKILKIMQAWDKSFEPWEPKYNRDFDLGNFKDEIAALIMAGNTPMPVELSRELLKKLVDRLDRIGSSIGEEAKIAIMKAIETFDPDAVLNNLALPTP